MSRKTTRLNPATNAPLSVGLALCAVAFLATLGCRTYHSIPETIGNNTACIDALMYEVDAGAPAKELPAIPLPPMTLSTPEEFENASYRDLTLQESIQIALSNSDVLRDLEATVLRTPRLLVTRETLGLVQTDPQSSVEAALSAFDAQFYMFGKWQNNDRRFNNRFFGGGANENDNAFKQDTHDYVVQMSKRTATGAQFAVRSVTDYDYNNATGNLDENAPWQTQFHAEVRQPLLQGGGLTFNRIAGPNSQPGIYNGVLIAKVDNDITSSKFRQKMRDYISNVINAYWDLYFAYRDLDAKRDALERSRKTWQSLSGTKNQQPQIRRCRSTRSRTILSFSIRASGCDRGETGATHTSQQFDLGRNVCRFERASRRPSDDCVC